MARKRNADTTLLILISLARGPLHGYAIRKAVLELSQGKTILSTGTLYGALKRLLDLRWIEALARPTAPGEETTRTRREYRLAEAGKKALSAELDRLRLLMDAAERVGTAELPPA